MLGINTNYHTYLLLGRSKALDLAVITPSLQTGTLGLRFYRLSNAGTPISLSDIQTSPIPDTQLDNTQRLCRYPLDATHSWLDTTGQTMTPADVPFSLTSSPLLPSLLCFYTSTATLKIHVKGWNGYWNEPYIVISDPASDVGMAGRWAWGGFERRPQREDVAGGVSDLGLPALGKFIVVGATRQRMTHGGALTLTLLMVETLAGDGDEGAVWRRRHLIREVVEGQWEKLSERTRKWELVYLL